MHARSRYKSAAYPSTTPSVFTPSYTHHALPTVTHTITQLPPSPIPNPKPASQPLNSLNKQSTPQTNLSKVPSHRSPSHHPTPTPQHHHPPPPSSSQTPDYAPPHPLALPYSTLALLRRGSLAVALRRLSKFPQKSRQCCVPRWFPS